MNNNYEEDFKVFLNYLNLHKNTGLSTGEITNKFYKEFPQYDTAKSAQSQPSTVLGWVDVRDRLPEVGEDVLVYLTAVVLKGVLYHDGWMVFYSDGLFECKDVTHWMPLPEPPNKSNSTPTPTNEKYFSLEQVKELLSQQRSMCADALWNNRFGFMGTMSEDQCKQMMIYIENYDAPTIKEIVSDKFAETLTEQQLKKYNEGIEDLKKKIMENKNK